MEVHQRAQGRCEYCLVPDGATLWPHEADHIIAEQHGGSTSAGNLALACFHCNRHKGPNLASLDGETGEITPLFHPRKQRWADHFRVAGARIAPLSAVGRSTVGLLRFNAPERLRMRQAMRLAGCWGV